MENLVKCNRCNQILIDEEYKNHVCTVLPKGEKIINADYFVVTKDSSGNPLVEIKGLDGFTYKFPIIPESELNKIPYQPNGNTDTTNPRGNRTFYIKGP